MRTIATLLCVLLVPAACGESNSTDSTDSTGGRHSTDPAANGGTGDGGTDGGTGGDAPGTGGAAGTGGRRTTGGTGGGEPGGDGGTGGGEPGGTGGDEPGGDGGSGALPELEAPILGKRQSWNGYSFIVPTGLVGTDNGESFDMNAANADEKGLCSLYMLPPVPAEGELPQQAYDILAQSLGEQLSPERSEWGDGDSREFPRHGQLSSGWNYVLLRSLVIERETFLKTDLYAHILLVDLGSQVAPIIGLQRSGNPCLGVIRDGYSGVTSSDRLMWPLLMYSLRFPGVEAPPLDPERLQGDAWSWTHQSTARYLTFLGDGRFQSEVFVNGGKLVSPTEAVLVTTGYFGDGSYSVHGAELTMSPDGSASSTSLFRIETEGASPYLSILRKDGKGEYYESYYYRR